MKVSRRRFVGGILAGTASYPLGRLLGKTSVGAMPRGETGMEIRFVRFERQGRRAYGILEGGRIKEIRGRPWEAVEETGTVHPKDEVRILCPCEPSKVLALAGNYKSHLESAPPPANPEVFIKAPSALLDPDGTIVIPEGTKDVHYEGELVVVIGKKAKNLSPTEASSCVLGVTCGNDVSARDWQKNDRQWWRAKACDTFGPVGPCIVSGLDYRDLLLRTRLNGEVKQEARTSELIFDVPSIVSFVSRHMTLLPGDIVLTGTPGTTSAMKPGDGVEVEIEKIGVLRNRVG